MMNPERLTAARPASASGAQQRCVLLLVSAGLVIQILLTAFILLYVNFPAGYNSLYGINRQSIPFFRTLWSYPVLRLRARTFEILATTEVLTLWAVYIGTSILVLRYPFAAGRRRMVFLIAGFAALFNITLAVAMPPVLSADIYHYALYGRMVAFHRLNPYTTLNSAVPSDPFWPLTSWHVVTTPYGPTWTLISAVIAALGNHSVLQTVLAFKVLAAMFNLAGCALVFLLGRYLTKGNGIGPLVLYAWNPLILIEAAGNGHCDIVMITLALLGLLLATRSRLLVGLAVLTLSVLVKGLTGPLMVFIVVWLLAREKSWRRRATLAGQMGAVTILVVAILCLPFSETVQKLEQFSPGWMRFPRNNPFHVVLRGWVAGKLVGRYGLGEAHAVAGTWVLWGAHLGFAALAVLLLKRSVTTKASWPRMLELWGVLSLVYILAVFCYLFPWYLISPLTAASFGLPTRAGRRFLALVIGFGVVLMLPYAMLALT